MNQNNPKRESELKPDTVITPNSISEKFLKLIGPGTTLLKEQSAVCKSLLVQNNKHSEHSKNHVHFNFEDFHCISNQDETQFSNIFSFENQINEFTQSELSDTDKNQSYSSEIDPAGSTTYELQSFEEKTYLGFSQKQWPILIVFLFAEMVSAILISFQPFLYPAEAEKKDVSATEFGLLFGFFELVVFLVSLLCRKYIDKVGPKLVFSLGLFITGSCAIIFGLLDQIDERVDFISLSFVIRFFEACGDAAFLTASYSIILSEFPQAVSISFVLKEICYGLGLVWGPTISAVLYQIDGFRFPFTLMGIIQIVIALMTFMVFRMNNSDILYMGESKRNSYYGILSLLKIPPVVLTVLNVFAAAFSIGFLSVTLEPQLRKFGLTSVLNGLIFAISACSFGVSSPIWGWICDKMMSAKFVSIIGSTLILIGFLLIGPAPFFPYEMTIEIITIGLAIHGIGLGAALVASFRKALKEILKYNFPDNIETYELVSRLWISVFALSSFISPIIAGVLYDQVGFRMGTYCVIGCQIFVILAGFGFIICCPKHSSRAKSTWTNGRVVQQDGDGTEEDYLLGKT